MTPLRSWIARRRFLLGMLAATAALYLVVTPPIDAHGVVAKVTAKAIDVTQKNDGKTISIVLTEKTAVTRDKKPIGRAELKAGLNVVVDARGDDIADLEAVEVRLVPSTGTK